jgi:hypothetical protein
MNNDQSKIEKQRTRFDLGIDLIIGFTAALAGVLITVLFLAVTGHNENSKHIKKFEQFVDECEMVIQTDKTEMEPGIQFFGAVCAPEGFK